MRLRRETGDYSIKVVYDGVSEYEFSEINRGLGAEDLIGGIVTYVAMSGEDVSSTLTSVITTVAVASDTISFNVPDGSTGITVDYDPATGALAIHS